jgi:hypothetical protein
MLGYWQTSCFNDGDTSLNGLTYKKLIHDGPNSGLVFVREDTAARKAWVILPDSTEALLYDFRLAPGAQFSAHYVGFNAAMYTVESIDSIQTTLGIRKRIKLVTAETTFTPYLYWIEGIGSSYSPVYLYDPTEGLEPTGLHGFCLVCAYRDIGVQAYAGVCGMYCLSYPYSPCGIFMGVSDKKEPAPEITIEKVSPGMLHICLDRGYMYELRVYSADGKSLKTITNINREDFLLSIMDWPPGVYIIEITSDKHFRQSVKFIK